MTYRGHISRAEAGLRAPRSRSHSIDASKGGVTGHHAGAAQHVSLSLSDHDRCYELVRGYQNYHMGKGWVDIAYTMLPCQHGFLFAGRGANVRTAANGTNSGNSYWYALCGILGGNERPSDDMIDAFWMGVRMLRREGGAADRTNRHSDHKGTSCPGNLGPVIDAGMTASGETGMLQRGDSGPAVAKAQKALLAFAEDRKGTDPIHGNSDQTWADARNYGADGDFGPATELMVKSFQHANDLPRTGRIDEATADRLSGGGSSSSTGNTTPSSWAEDDWEWGLDNGFVNGPDDDHPSDPHATVTKQELIAILRRYDRK